MMYNHHSIRKLVLINLACLMFVVSISSPIDTVRSKMKIVEENSVIGSNSLHKSVVDKSKQTSSEYEDDDYSLDTRDRLQLENHLADLKRSADVDSLGSSIVRKISKIFKENVRVSLRDDKQDEQGRRFIVHKGLLPRALVGKMNDSNIFDSFIQEKLPSTDEKNLVIFLNKTTIYAAIAATKYFHFRLLQPICAAIIFLVIFFGNILVLNRLWKLRRKRSNMNYFLAHLAIADLLVGIFSLMLDTLSRVSISFPSDQKSCLAVKYLSTLFIFASTFLLVALSLDRWEAVVKPLSHAKNRRRCLKLVLGSWILASIVAAPMLRIAGMKAVDGFEVCMLQLKREQWPIYMLFLLFSILIIPTSIIATCCSHIVYTIWRRSKTESTIMRYRSAPNERITRKELVTASNTKPSSIQASRDFDLKSSSCSLNTNHSDRVSEIEDPQLVSRGFINNCLIRLNRQIPNMRQTCMGKLNITSNKFKQDSKINTNERKNNNKSERKTQLVRSFENQLHGGSLIPRARVKTIKMTLLIVFAYLTSWSPFLIINTLNVYGFIDAHLNPTWQSIITLSQTFSFLNSAVNPIIYWIFNCNCSCARPISSSTTTTTTTAAATTLTTKRRKNGKDNFGKDQQDQHQMEPSSACDENSNITSKMGGFFGNIFGQQTSSGRSENN